MSRVIACWLAVLLVLQGLAVAGQRVLPGGHFHALPALERAHGDAHFHLAVGFHQHDAGLAGVVQVEAQDEPSVEAMNLTLKRLELDQPQLRAAAPAAVAYRVRSLARADVGPAWRSHVSAPQERPPRGVA